MILVEIAVSSRYFSIYTGTEIQYSLVNKDKQWTTSSIVEFNHYDYDLGLLIFYVDLNHVYYFK
jgi:hypothetical protein